MFAATSNPTAERPRQTAPQSLEEFQHQLAEIEAYRSLWQQAMQDDSPFSIDEQEFNALTALQRR